MLNVKVGSKVVCVRSSYGDITNHIVEVTKITSAGRIHTSNGGYYLASGESATKQQRYQTTRSWIVELTPELETEIKQANAVKNVVKMLRDITTADLSYEKAVQIYNILKSK